MGRLSDKLKKATAAMDGVETAVDRDVDKFIERVDAFHKRREQVFMKKNEALDAHVSDLAQFERDLEEFGKNDHSDDGANGSAYVGTNPSR